MTHIPGHSATFVRPEKRLSLATESTYPLDELREHPLYWALFRDDRVWAVGYALHLERSRPEIRQYLREALEGAVGTFLAANGPPGEPVTVWRGGEQVEAVTSGDRDHVSSFEFEIGFGLAWTLRRPDMARALAGTFDVLASQNAPEDTYRIAFSHALNQLGFDNPQWRETLDEAFAYAPRCHPDIQEYRDALILPQMRLLAAWGDRDNARFNVALEDAMRRHYAYWSQPGRDDEPVGRVAWLPLGICARAHDDGMPIEVECDYIPDWLVRGEIA